MKDITSRFIDDKLMILNVMFLLLICLSCVPSAAVTYHLRYEEAEEENTKSSYFRTSLEGKAMNIIDKIAKKHNLEKDRDLEKEQIGSSQYERNFETTLLRYFKRIEGRRSFSLSLKKKYGKEQNKIIIVLLDSNSSERSDLSKRVEKDIRKVFKKEFGDRFYNVAFHPKEN